MPDLLHAPSAPSAPSARPCADPPAPAAALPIEGAMRLLAAGQRAASRGDAVAALLAYDAARRRAAAAQAPALAAEAGRRLDRLALRLRPPAAAEAVAAWPAHPAARAWVRQVLRLPPPLVLLVLARARWFAPADPGADRRRAPLARALLAGLDDRRPTVDAPLRAFLLASPLVAADSAPILERGLAAYAAGDALTALHLLVPRLEALLRGLAAAPGVPPEPSRATAGSGLDGLLRHPPLRRALGEGLAIQLRAVLLADGLRHRLAHGRLPPAACTRAVAQDVVLCYVRLSRRPAATPAPVAAPSCA